MLALNILLIVVNVVPLSAEENKTNSYKKEISSYTPNSEYGFRKDKSPKIAFSKCSEINDKEIKVACKKAFIKKFKNYEFELTHRKNVLQWQHLSTQIILFVVLMLVSMGLYFAWVQFHSNNLKQRNQEISEVEISTSGIKISSPILGVIILTLSLGFFYLYLVYVYPITIISPQKG